MKSRLALVACKHSTQGPWIRPRGNETGIRVMHLGKNEHILAVAEFEDSTQKSQKLDREGVFELPIGWLRIRFDKKCDGEGECHTQVDLLVA